MLDCEISILRGLDHPHILKLQAVLKTVNHCYLITEMCEGGDLAGLIKKRGRIPESEAVALFGKIVGGF
jgi:serine/threonine-protein kinase ULK/ATG1